MLSQAQGMLLYACRFECQSDGSYLQILHVSLEPTSEDVDDDFYDGPVCWS